MTLAAAAAPRGHVQIPRSLLYSSDHGALAVWAWAMYETLMPHGLGGGRAPAVARRRYVAERAGTSTSALDDARRELLAAAPGGPYLSRSTPRGAKRSVKHAALRLPRQTGEPFSPVPFWTLDLVWAGRRRPAGRVSPDAWRLYAACVDRASRTGAPRAFDATVGRLGAVLRVSAATGRRRLAELEATGLVEVTERTGGWLSVRAVLNADEAVDVARTYATEGRRHAEPRPPPAHIAALTPSENRQMPLTAPGTPQESPPTEVPAQKSKDLPVRDGKIRRTARARATATAGKPKTQPKGRPTPKLTQLAQHAQEVEPLFRSVHAEDLRPGENPRTGEAGWNISPVSGSAAPSGGAVPQTTRGSEPMSKPTPAPHDDSGYEAEAVALRGRLTAAPCPRCGRGPPTHPRRTDHALDRLPSLRLARPHTV